MYSLDWPRAYGTPESTALFKCTPEDFQVHEFFAGSFSGEGEHVLLKIEKRGVTTEEVVKSLARLLNKPARLISYAGLKDRQALSTQWLSIHAPGEEISGLDDLTAPGWRVLEWTRHNKKLKPGFLAGNRFVIQLKDLSNPQDLEQRIAQVQHSGVPNYFGEQRFGRAANNLVRAEELLVHGARVKDRFLKGIYYSAARSWLYNLILGLRVGDLSWNQPLMGDVMQLRGSNSIFVLDELDATLIQRVQDKDISPACPLPGKSKNMVKGDALVRINEIYTQWSAWIQGLEQHGLEESWRATVLHVDQLHYTIHDRVAELSFTLPAGAYATTVLRELVRY